MTKPSSAGCLRRRPGLDGQQRISQATPKPSTADFQAKAVIDGIIRVETIGSSVHDYYLAIRNGPSGTLYSGGTAPNKRRNRPAPLQ